MASFEPLSEPNSIVGAIVPGDGRLRFCRSTLSGMKAGDWVVVDGPNGSEPGQIVFATGEVDVPPTVKIVSSVSRMLAETELSQVEVNAHHALSLIESAKRVAEAADADLQLTSLRLTLDSSMILCSCCGRTTEPPAHLERQLGEALNHQIRVEWSDRPAQSFGSLGRIRSDDRYAELAIRDRLGIDSPSSDHFPNGWPRLGGRVGSPVGTGRLIAVSARHNTATIQLDSGDETILPVDELTAPGG